MELKYKKARDGFETEFQPGVRLFNKITQKPCLISIAVTFYCDQNAQWNETAPNVPGEGPEPEDFSFTSSSLFDTCTVLTTSMFIFSVGNTFNTRYILIN